MAPAPSKCLGYHFDAPGLFVIRNPSAYRAVQESGAQPFVLLCSLWEDAEMFIGEILPGPIIGTVLHVAPLPKDWIVLFSANLPHGVWRVPGSHKTRASVTHRGYITPALYQQERPGVKIKDATDLVRLPLNLEFGGIQVFQLKQGHINYVAPKRHGQKQHILSQIKLAWEVLPMSTGVPGDREAWQAGHHFQFPYGPVRGYHDYPAPLVPEIKRTFSWAPDGCHMWVTNIIYNWYPGNDLERGIEWWSRIPRAQRVISKSRARKDRAQLKKNGIPLRPSLFTSLHLRIICGRTRVDKLGRLRN